MTYPEKALIRTIVLGADNLARYVPADGVGAYARSTATFTGTSDELTSMLASKDPEVWRPHCSKNTLFRLTHNDKHSLHLRIEAGVWHNSEWIVPVPVEVSAVLVPELLAERGEPLDTEGKSASWRSREETLTHTYEELVDESWVSTWEPVADKTAHCMAVPGQKKTERDPLDSSDDEEGGADEEEPPKQKKSAPAKSAKPAKAKTTYVPDDGVAVQTGSEEEETPVRGDAEATSEDECILAFARNLWCFPSTAVVGKIGKPIVLSDELYATLRKKTKVPYGRVLSHEVLTMLTGVDNNGEQSRGLYVRYAPKSSPEKKIVLIALSKEVCEFHIGKIVERAEKAGVTEETFPCLSWKPHDLKNGGQIRPQESGWEKSNAPKELLDITTGKRSGPDDDDSASTAIVPTSVGAAKSNKAARIESGTQWIDIDSASDGLKIVKINIGENDFHVLPRQGQFLRIAVLPIESDS